MKIIYFDCTNGISGDMAFSALFSLAEEERQAIQGELSKLEHHGFDHHHEHEHGMHSHNHSHRSYNEIRHLIAECGVSPGAKEKALAIYAVIAKAEAFVHEVPIEEVHFHEVGREEAVRNIVGAAICLEKMGIGQVYCSPLHDGKGFIDCSHGRIPVPVPAVMAMRRDCNYTFITDEVETEMVTPSGLAVLMGLDAICVPAFPAGRRLKETVAFGKRQIGKEGGLRAYLLHHRK